MTNINTEVLLNLLYFTCISSICLMGICIVFYVKTRVEGINPPEKYSRYILLLGIVLCMSLIDIAILN